MMMWLRLITSWMFLVGHGGLQAWAETWRIASLEWPPYAGSSLTDGGAAISALRKALENADIRLEVDYMPWTRAQAVAQTANYVGYFPAWPEEVLDGFVASAPVSLSLVGVMQREYTTASWTTIEEMFQNYRVGFVRSYVYPAALQRQIYHYYDPEDGAENEHDLARVLAAGRVDFALTDPAVMLHVAEELSLRGIDKNAKILQKHPLVMAISMKSGHEAKLELINKLLAIQSDASSPTLLCCVLDTPQQPPGADSRQDGVRPSHSGD